MKLASLKSNDRKKRDGELVVVSRDNQRAMRVDPAIASTLLQAVQSWEEVSPRLQSLYDALNQGKAAGSFTPDPKLFAAPLTNCPGLYDGSAFLSHVHRARRARNDVMPESAKVTPLMYQGVSDNQLGPHDPLPLMSPEYGGDFEGEFAVITDDVPKGTPASAMDRHMILFTMFNDITYREIVKVEIETKFGFLQSKPNSAFAPFAVTPDELGSAWDGKRIHLDLLARLNGIDFGHPNGREMHFSFGDLVAHACRTRPLSAGSIVGTGTVSNENKEVGFACLTEKRFQEIIDSGKPQTPWLKAGDQVYMDVQRDGRSVFGTIEQRVVV